MSEKEFDYTAVDETLGKNVLDDKLEREMFDGLDHYGALL